MRFIMDKHYVNLLRKTPAAVMPRRQGAYRNMTKRTRRRRRSWSRLLLLVVFVAAALYAGYFCLFRAPEVPADTSQPDETETISDQETVQDPEAEARAAHLERKPYFYTILLSGCDDGNGNSDTNILVAVDATNGYIHGVSIARDTKAVWDGKSHKINAAFGSGGAEKLAEVIGDQLGIPVDFTVSVDLTGFEALVDAIDGVDFEVPINMNYDDPYQDLHIHFNAGMQHLTGEEAMKVVRFRHNNDGSGYTDVGRAEMQRQVLVALAKKVVSWNSLTKVQEFVEIFQEYVKTDLSTTDMLYFASQAVGVDLDTGITQGTLEGRGEGVVRGYKYCFVFQAEDILPTLNELVNPYDQPLTEEDLDLPQAEYYWNGTVIN